MSGGSETASSSRLTTTPTTSSNGVDGVGGTTSSGVEGNSAVDSDVAPPEATTTASTASTAATTGNASPSKPSSEDPMRQLPFSQITITMYIPTTCVGAVIGRRGSTIANIQKQAQTPNAPPVRVSIVGHNQQPNNSSADNGTTNTSEVPPSNAEANPDATNAEASSSPPSNSATPSNATTSIPATYTPLDWSDPAWTPVVIRADPFAALKVASGLQPLCTSLQDTIVDIPLSRQRHSTLVGKRGVTVMQLSADTACRIWIPPKDLKLDTIQLEGPLDRCIPCFKAIAKHLNNSSAPGNNTGDPKDKSAPSASPRNHQATLVLPGNRPLPSQTKLRSVGRKTDTIIKKKKVSITATEEKQQEKDDNGDMKASTEDQDESTSNPAVNESPMPTPTPTPEKAKKPSVEGEEDDDNEDAPQTAPPTPSTPSLDVAWHLIISGRSQAQVQTAYQMLQKWSEQQQRQPSSSTANNVGGASGSESTGNRGGKGGRGGGRGGGGRGRGRGKGRGRGGGGRGVSNDKNAYASDQ